MMTTTFETEKYRYTLLYAESTLEIKRTRAMIVSKWPKIANFIRGCFRSKIFKPVNTECNALFVFCEVSGIINLLRWYWSPQTGQWEREYKPTVNIPYGCLYCNIL